MIPYYINLGFTTVAAVLLWIAGKARPEFQIGKVLSQVVMMVTLLCLSASIALTSLPLSLSFWVLAGYSVVIGVVHVVVLYRQQKWARPALFLRELLLTLIITLAGITSFAFAMTKLRPELSPVALSWSLTFFILPFLLHKALYLWKDIPPPIFSTWQYPVGKPVPELVFQQTIPVQFDFSKSPQQDEKTVFTVVAPSGTLFGDLFHLFVIDYNQQFADTPIQEVGPPYEWIFYINPQRWWQKRKLINPELNVAQNNIQANEIVSAVRVSYS